MLLPWQAREHRRRPEPETPAARQAEQSPAHDAGGEVLLCDRGVTAQPALSELAQIRQDDLAQQRVHGRHGEQPVEDRLRPRLVVPVERVGEIVPHRLGTERHRCRFVADPGPQRERRRLGGGQAVGEVLAHDTHALDVRGRVEAQAAGRAHGAKEPVTALPRAQQLRAHPRALAQLPDPEDSVAVHAADCTASEQTLDKDADGGYCAVHGQHPYREVDR